MKPPRGMRAPRISSLVGGVAIALVLATVPGQPADGARIPCKTVQLFIEFNSTDGDAGIQAFLDRDAWKAVRIVGPDGRAIFDVDEVGS